MHRTFIAATVVLAGMTASSCSTVSAQLDGAQTTSATADDAPTSILATRQWGVVDGMLSVVVENTSDRTLRYADGVINARTDENELVATSVETDSSCCGIVDLRPGEQYGFYLDVGTSTPEISRVDLSYRNFSWAPADETVATGANVRARPVDLERDAEGAVVLADLVSDAGQAEVITQAFVADANGELLAVVSGRWTCLETGKRAIRMELFHPLPEDARVDRIVVHPVTDDPTRPAPECETGGPGL